MKKILSIALVIMVVALMSVYAGEKAWFDMENCEFCKPMATQMDMMNNIGWDHYKITNGTMTVTIVPGEHAAGFDKLREHWKTTVERAMKGEEITMCGMCAGMGDLMMKGAKTEDVKTNNGFVTLMTSDNAEVVTAIHAWTDKTSEEHEKNMKEKMYKGKAHKSTE